MVTAFFSFVVVADGDFPLRSCSRADHVVIPAAAASSRSQLAVKPPRRLNEDRVQQRAVCRGPEDFTKESEMSAQLRSRGVGGVPFTE